MKKKRFNNIWYFIFLVAIIVAFILVAILWNDGVVFAFMGGVIGLSVLIILRFRKFLLYGK